MPASQAKNSTPLLDRDVLNELAGLSDEAEFLPLLIKNYLLDTKKLFSSIKLASDSDNIEELDDLLHAMKGSALHVGCLALANYAGLFRKRLCEIEPRQIEDYLEELLVLIEDTEKELAPYSR